MKIEYELLISKNPINITDDWGIKKPLIQDIWDITYDKYILYCNILSIDKFKYLEINELLSDYNNLNEEDKKRNSLFNLITNNSEFIKFYNELFSFFIGLKVKYFMCINCFVIFKDLEIYTGQDKKHIKKIVGLINNDNFEDIREIILQINYLSKTESDSSDLKYKNSTAQKWAEKIANGKEKKAQRENKNKLSFGKMISKYCADNKNGINILNVSNMTIYQFYDQWIEHNHMKQCDIQDMVYTNTVSFSDLKSYDSQLWLK